MRNSFVPLWAGLASTACGSVVPPSDPENSKQCTGLVLDFDRVQAVTNDDLQSVTQTLLDSRSLPGASKGYGVNTVVPVVKIDNSECLFQRHRLQETKEGVAIFGADIVVTVQDCSPPNVYGFGGGYEQSPLSGVPIQSISDLDGITFTSIDEPRGYTPTKSKEEATQAIADHYTIPKEKVGAMETIVFPSTVGDFLSYKTEVVVAKSDDIQLYDVIISAHTLELLNICRKTNTHGERIARRRLRSSGRESEERELQVNCVSCASQEGSRGGGIDWSDEKTECPINSLYLDDTNKTAICVKGTQNGQEVLGPGAVPELFYAGTFDCMESEDKCYANPLPTDCSDALSDVHYGIIETLKFYREYVGVMGGLRVSASRPESFSSYTHYGRQYCNAYFTTQTNDLFFGSCDCDFWTPLTSLDVVAHELTHGITSESSSLIYAYQPGGLNEGYSDVMAATIEFYVNDTKDRPDFLLGENLGGDILRNMENPPADGNSIDNVCSFNNDLTVHHTSGVLNKAFVSSVKACEANGCSSERDCVLLMGPLFMYTNIQKLTKLSGYLDSASKTCAIVDEFYSVRQPTTTCTASQATQFVRDGWAQVGVTLNGECDATSQACVVPNAPGGTGFLFPFIARLVNFCSNIRDFFTGIGNRGESW